jgi:hypothetical protein
MGAKSSLLGDSRTLTTAALRSSRIGGWCAGVSFLGKKHQRRQGRHHLQHIERGDPH